MTENIIVMPGSSRVDLPALQAIAREFGWKVDVAHDLGEVAVAQANRKTVAVLVHRDSLGRGHSWPDTIRLLRRALPEGRVVACHGFAESIDWPQLCDAGAFHALWLPLRENECVKVSVSFGKRRSGSPFRKSIWKLFPPGYSASRGPVAFQSDPGRTALQPAQLLLHPTD